MQEPTTGDGVEAVDDRLESGDLPWLEFAQVGRRQSEQLGELMEEQRPRQGAGAAVGWMPVGEFRPERRETARAVPGGRVL